MSARPSAFTWNEALHFGPPSQLIDIQKFYDEAAELHQNGFWPWFDFETHGVADDDALNKLSGWESWKEAGEDIKRSIKDDCDLDDMKRSLAETVSLPKKIAYIKRFHVSAALDLTTPKDTSQTTGSKDEDIEPLKQSIANTSLKMWKLEPAAASYIRPGRISDQNAIHVPQFNHSRLQSRLPVSHDILITLTTYTRNRWYPYGFSRGSQHVFLSSSNLADVWDCVPCILKGDGKMPVEIVESEPLDPSLEPYPGMPMKSRVVGYNEGNPEQEDLMVMVIEDKAYCNARGSPDYADKLFSHIQALQPEPLDDEVELIPGPYERPKRTAPLRKGGPIHAVTLRSLSMRINEPYWILHRGDCEHWFVIDEIRLQNPRDPISRYPITIQRTPVARALCRICTKAPATLSILNDIRLGETPSLVCSPCWELFGGPPPPKESEDLDARVVVVPIVSPNQ